MKKMRLVVLMAILAIIATVIPVSASDHASRRRSDSNDRSDSRRSQDRRHDARSSRNDRNYRTNYHVRSRYNDNRYRYNDNRYNEYRYGFRDRFGIRINVRPPVVIYAEPSYRDEELAYAQGALAELRAEREQRREIETARAAAARTNDGEVAQTPQPVVQPPTPTFTTKDLQGRPSLFTVFNGTGETISVNGKILKPTGSDRATVSDPDNIEISGDDTLCTVDAEYTDTDTIVVVCVSPKARE